MGRGFSVSNLQYMRRFYLTHQKQQTVSVKLSWSHYCELLALKCGEGAGRTGWTTLEPHDNVLFHSHSIVAGGLGVMSYTTRLTPGTSATMRLDMPPRTS